MLSEQKKKAVLTILSSVENGKMDKNDALGVILAITDDGSSDRCNYNYLLNQQSTSTSIGNCSKNEDVDLILS